MTLFKVSLIPIGIIILAAIITLAFSSPWWLNVFILCCCLPFLALARLGEME